jgi:hypothetical protein
MQGKEDDLAFLRGMLNTKEFKSLLQVKFMTSQAMHQVWCPRIQRLVPILYVYCLWAILKHCMHSVKWNELLYGGHQTPLPKRGVWLVRIIQIYVLSSTNYQEANIEPLPIINHCFCYGQIASTFHLNSLSFTFNLRPPHTIGQ